MNPFIQSQRTYLEGNAVSSSNGHCKAIVSQNIDAQEPPTRHRLLKHTACVRPGVTIFAQCGHEAGVEEESDFRPLVPAIVELHGWPERLAIGRFA